MISFYCLQCDLSNVDIISLEEVVLVMYEQLPSAMTEMEQRRNPKVMELCTSTDAFTEVLKAPLKVNGTTVVHLAAAVPENESVVQLACCQMPDQALATPADDGRTALQVALTITEGGEGAALYLARRTADLDYLQPSERVKLFLFAVRRGSVGVVGQAVKWVEELQSHKVELIQAAVTAGQDAVLELVLAALGKVGLKESGRGGVVADTFERKKQPWRYNFPPSPLPIAGAHVEYFFLGSPLPTHMCGLSCRRQWSGGLGP